MKNSFTKGENWLTTTWGWKKVSVHLSASYVSDQTDLHKNVWRNSVGNAEEVDALLWISIRILNAMRPMCRIPIGGRLSLICRRYEFLRTKAQSCFPTCEKWAVNFVGSEAGQFFNGRRSVNVILQSPQFSIETIFDVYICTAIRCSAESALLW